MARTRTRLIVTALALLGSVASASTVTADRGSHGDHDDHDDDVVRFATFNASLNRNSAGQLIADLSTPDNAQARAVAEVIQRLDPDVLLINEFDYDEGHVALDLFQDELPVGRRRTAPIPIDYPYAYTAPSNTGIPSGFDLDNNGVGRRAGNDALRLRLLPGPVRHGRLLEVPDRHPTPSGRSSTSCGRTCPARCCPTIPPPPQPADWYSAEELAVLPLSSKSHWDVPIEIGDETVHFLVSHPTPPVFDGPEDRNGTRNPTRSASGPTT